MADNKTEGKQTEGMPQEISSNARLFEFPAINNN